MKVKSLSQVRLFATPWTAAYQAPLSMGFSRQERWSGVPLPSPSQVAGLLLLRSFCGPFSLASGGFLAAPRLISNCSNLPFGTQGRSKGSSLAYKKWETKRPPCPGAPRSPTQFHQDPCVGGISNQGMAGQEHQRPDNSCSSLLAGWRFCRDLRQVVGYRILEISEQETVDTQINLGKCGHLWGTSCPSLPG